MSDLVVEGEHYVREEFYRSALINISVLRAEVERLRLANIKTAAIKKCDMTDDAQSDIYLEGYWAGVCNATPEVDKLRGLLRECLDSHPPHGLDLDLIQRVLASINVQEAKP